MLEASDLNECLLELALQRNLNGFQQSLKRTFAQLDLNAWAAVFPPSQAVEGRPILLGHGIRPENSPLLSLATRHGLETIFPNGRMEAPQLTRFAREMNPEPNGRFRIFQNRRERGGEFILFCYRPAKNGDFTPNDIAVLSRVARIVDRCFLALAEAQEQEFESGLFRLIGNLHPEGLCVLDNRFRVLFENRKFKEQMHVWNHGLVGLKNLTLPKQSELPATWQEACKQSFQAFREVKFPPTSGRMVVTQGSLSALRLPLDAENWMEGAVRYLAFQSALGVRPYLLLTCAFRHRQASRAEVTSKVIAEKHHFSRRETELAELILQGGSAQDIAKRLKIALPTVKTHIRHILHKAGVKTRLQFVGLCRAPR